MKKGTGISPKSVKDGVATCYAPGRALEEDDCKRINDTKGRFLEGGIGWLPFLTEEHI